MNIIHGFNFKKTIKKKNIIIYLPGSKSITNRLLLLTGLYNKNWIKLINPLVSTDTEVMINLLKKKFKTKIIKKKGVFLIKGNYKFKIKKNIFNIKNAGTVARPLIALTLLNNQAENIIITGNKQMQNRPIKQLINIIKKITNTNKHIIYIKKHNSLPILIKNFNKINSKLIIKNKIKIINIKSSQYISAILLILHKFIKKSIQIKIIKVPSSLYIIMTIKILKIFNINIKYFKGKIIIKKSELKFNNKFLIEGDLTAATYLYNMYISKNIKIIIGNIKKENIQGDKNIINIIKHLGLNIKNYKNIYTFLKKNQIKKKIFGLTLDCDKIPDSSMSLISLLTIKNIKIIKLYNIYTWQYKESNRLKAISKEIKKTNTITIKGKNWIYIIKKNLKKIKEIEFKSYKDHRLSMCFATAFNINNINIRNPNCVKKTYPNFYKDIKWI